MYQAGRRSSVSEASRSHNDTASSPTSASGSAASARALSSSSVNVSDGATPSPYSSPSARRSRPLWAQVQDVGRLLWGESYVRRGAVPDVGLGPELVVGLVRDIFGQAEPGQVEPQRVLVGGEGVEVDDHQHDVGA